MIAEFEHLSINMGKTPVLKDLNWTIPKAQVVGLLGKNGAGKSTLIRSLLGLVLPDHGTVQLFGTEPRNMGDNEKARLAYVPQTAMGYEGMKVSAAVLLHASCYPSWNQSLADRMLAKFDIPQTTRVERLSGGQRQALMLVFALGCQPEFLVMDEPVASLDPSARREVLQFIAEAAGGDCSILYSTHITADVNRLADQVAMLADGQIQFCRPADEISQTVLVQGELPDAFIQSEAFAHSLLKQAGNQTLLCNFSDDMQKSLPAACLIQPLNLEETFIRWHALSGDDSLRSNNQSELNVEA